MADRRYYDPRQLDHHLSSNSRHPFPEHSSPPQHHRQQSSPSYVLQSAPPPLPSASPAGGTRRADYSMAGGSSTTSSTSHRSSRPWEGDTEGHAHIASSPAYHRSPLARTSQPHAFQGDMDFSDADFSRPHGQLAPSLHRNGREHRHVGMDSDEDDAMYDKRPRRENSNVSLGASLVCVLSTDSARFGSLDFTCIAPGGGRRQRRRVMMMMMIFRCALLSETRTLARHTSWAEHLRHISIQMRHAGAFARTHSRAHTLPRGASLPSLHSLAGAHRRAGAFLRSHPPVLRLDAHISHTPLANRLLTAPPSSFHRRYPSPRLYVSPLTTPTATRSAIAVVYASTILDTAVVPP